MKSRYQAVLNDVSLSDINPKILITDISHREPKFRRFTSQLANRDGIYAGEETLSGASVGITFMIREYSTAKRQEIYQQVVAWCMNGGVLQVNDRPGQRLVCLCDELPVIGSAKKWTNELSVVFSGYEHPFWEELYPASVLMSGESGEGTLFVPGSLKTAYVEVKATPTTSVDDITFIVNDTVISLVNCDSEDEITITYDSKGIQHIKAGDTSILNLRTGNSSDDLIANCGKLNNVSFVSSDPVSVTFSARGVWL